MARLCAHAQLVHRPPCVGRIVSMLRRCYLIGHTEVIEEGKRAGSFEHCFSCGWPSRSHALKGTPKLRWVTTAQLSDYLRGRKPWRQFQAHCQSASDLGARDGKGPGPARSLILGYVPAAVRQVNHLLEWHDLDAKLGTVLAKKFLCLIRIIEGQAVRLKPRPRMVPSHDEVGSTVVLADNGVPEGFARSTHTHGEREERKHHPVLRVARQDCLVAAHPRLRIDVPGLRHPHHRVDQQIGVLRKRGAKGELLVGSVHRITCLERDHPNPATTCKLGTQLRGGMAMRKGVQVPGVLQD